MKRRNPSRFQLGDLIKIKRSYYGFPQGYGFEVVEGDKKPGYANGHKHKYTILARDPLAQDDTTYVFPVDDIDEA